MRIRNSTGWETGDLRRIFAAVVRECARHGDVCPFRLNIRVMHASDSCVRGRAWVGTGHMTLRLPRPECGRLDPFTVAWLFDHEFAHCRGLRHKTMGRLNDFRTATGEYYGYVSGLEIREATPKPALKTDMQIVRYEHALAKAAERDRILKRAATAARKWRAKVRYYERVLEADGRLAAWRARRDG